MNFKTLITLLILAFSSPAWAEVDSINVSSQDSVVASEATSVVDKQWTNNITLIIDKAYELWASAEKKGHQGAGKVLRNMKAYVTGNK